MRCLLFLTLLLAGCGGGSGPAPYMEVTHNYQMPPELQGCKVYVLGGGWSNTYPLWVVVSPEGKIISSR